MTEHKCSHCDTVMVGRAVLDDDTVVEGYFCPHCDRLPKP